MKYVYLLYSIWNKDTEDEKAYVVLFFSTREKAENYIKKNLIIENFNRVFEIEQHEVDAGEN